MLSKVELEREWIQQILEVESLEGLPLVWLQTRLAMIVSGTPPEEVFSRQQRINQKNSTTVSHAEIALKINELRLTGCKILRAKELVAEQLNTSFSNADLAWKKHGSFCRKDLPRESK